MKLLAVLRSILMKSKSASCTKLFSTSTNRFLYVLLGHSGFDFCLPMLAGFAHLASTSRVSVLGLSCNATQCELHYSDEQWPLLSDSNVHYQAFDLLRPEAMVKDNLLKVVCATLELLSCSSTRAVALD